MHAHHYQLGMVGLGVMGRNLVLNIADHGVTVAGYDKDPDQVDALQREAEDRPIGAVKSLTEFVAALGVPRIVMMLVPAGPVVDSVIRDLLPHLASGDLIVDGGTPTFGTPICGRRCLPPRGSVSSAWGCPGASTARATAPA